jgi:hypothetical protein
MSAIEFVWDSRDLEVWRGGKVESALAAALSKAGGDAIRSTAAESNRMVRRWKRMKVAALKKALPLTFPGTKEIARLAWRMDVSGALVPVSAYPLRQTRKGISVAINTGARSFIRSAFVATMRSGHRGVFLRDGKGRLPIKEAFTTRVSDVFRDEGFIPAVHAKAAKTFASSFARLMPLEVAKMRAKGAA